MLFSIYQFSIVHHLKAFPKYTSRYWFMAPSAKKKFIIIWLWKYLRGEFPCIFTEPNNCYRWFVMTSGHCFSSFSPCDGLTATQSRNLSIKSHSKCTSWAIHLCAWNATCEKSKSNRPYYKPWHDKIFSCCDIDGLLRKAESSPGGLACFHRDEGVLLGLPHCPCLITRYPISFLWVIRVLTFLVWQFLDGVWSFSLNELLNQGLPFFALSKGLFTFLGIVYELSLAWKSYNEKKKMKKTRINSGKLPTSPPLR